MKKNCENCGNTRCKNMIVAALYDECLESNYEKYWKPIISCVSPPISKSNEDIEDLQDQTLRFMKYSGN